MHPEVMTTKLSESLFIFPAALAILSAVPGCSSQNGSPELLPIAAQHTSVGSLFELRIQAHDPDGDRLRFGFSSPTEGMDGRARITALQGEAVFAWTPLASDVGEHQIEFTASDGNETDRESVTLNVAPSTDGDGVPVFRQPLGTGTTLDLATTRCLDLNVEVEDLDSLQVEISQNPAVLGSTIEALGPFQARFSWCPTEKQAGEAVYLLGLVADDHENPAVTKDFAIIVRTSLPSGCAGEAPVIDHTPPGPLEGTDPIAITAEVTDDVGLKSHPVLYYTLEKPADPAKIEFSALSQIEMKRDSFRPDKYETAVPNPTASLQPGESATVYYVIVAEDDDDRGGNCDHRSRLPQSTLFEVTVTRPAGMACVSSGQCLVGQMCDQGACVDDACSPNDTNGDGLLWEQGTCPADHFCPEPGAKSASHCVRTCQTDSDCPTPWHRCKVFDLKGGCGLAGKKEVGQRCSDFTGCAGIAMCLPWPGGYCAVSNCDTEGDFSGACPDGSACIPVGDDRFLVEAQWVCLKLCGGDEDCRKSEGYSCMTVVDDMGGYKNVCAR